MKNFFSQKKTYYSISEVAEISGVNTYVLRFWENKFPKFLHPKKDRAGRRRYRKEDLELVLIIVDLLYQRKFTIDGANLELDKMSHQDFTHRLKNEQFKNQMTLRQIKQSLEKINKSIKNAVQKAEKRIGLSDEAGDDSLSIENRQQLKLWPDR
ncbi:MAG: MerR family transcriptional regulator [bacterium]